MKKLLLLIFASMFLFSGCIEIIEEMTINPDKSGTVSFNMDLGTLGGLAINMGEKYMQSSMLDQIKKMPETIAGMLKGIDGLSNIKPITNKKGMYSVSFDFKNAKQLNEAIYKLLDVKKHFFEPNYLRLTKSKLVKKNYAPELRFYINKYRDQLKDKNVLNFISYKSIFHFPEEVKKFSNKKYTLSSDKKTLEFKCTLEELLSEKANIGNRVKY
jgi:hypothetical protein